MADRGRERPTRSQQAIFPSNYKAFPPDLAFATRFQAISAAFPVDPRRCSLRSASGGRLCFQGAARLVSGSGRVLRHG